MSRGFTLLEVVVALLVLEVGVLGAVGFLTLASRTLARAERLERAVSVAEGVVDSLAARGVVTTGEARQTAGRVSWTGGPAGRLRVVAEDPSGDTLFVWVHALPVSGAGG